MQFNGKIIKITENSIEFSLDSEENKEVILKEAVRLKKFLLTVYSDKEYKATFLQKRKIRELVEKISETIEIDTELDKDYVVEKYLKKKFGVENLYDGMKEEVSILIDGLMEFCRDNDIVIHETPIDQQEINKIISSSNKHKSCCKCGQPGETIELKAYHSKLICEFRMGYRFITLCSTHYIESLDTGVQFFKDNHLIISRKDS